VVVWEIAIKASLGRLRISRADLARLPALIDEAGFDELPVHARHASRVYELPAHHRDPFDRLLVAQTLVDDLTLVSVDPAFSAYGVPIL
jgi:PIN domain nuclease of toxin-antitoxin system